MAETAERPQNAGEICKSCIDFQRNQGKPGVKLRDLPGVTINKKDKVPACEYCDGEQIFKVKDGS